MTDIYKDIRPYTAEELPAVIEELIADSQFRDVIGMVFPQMPFDAFAAKARSCQTSLDFQKAFCYPFLKQLAADKSSGMSMDSSAESPPRFAP